MPLPTLEGQQFRIVIVSATRWGAKRKKKLFAPRSPKPPTHLLLENVREVRENEPPLPRLRPADALVAG